jgi:hypothetical protein
MTHVQLVLAIYGAVCVGATLGYVIAHQLATAHKSLSSVRASIRTYRSVIPRSNSTNRRSDGDNFGA